MAFTSDELTANLNQITGGDLTVATRLMQEVYALDVAFQGDLNALGATFKLFAGVAQRMRLEVQRDATFRAIQDKQTALQQTQQALQQESVTASQQTQAETSVLQQQAAVLQAQIDAINAQLPDLLH